MWSLFSHDAITGNHIDEVWPKGDASWSMNLSGTGECSFSFQVNDAETGLKREKIDALFTPNARLLSLRWYGVVMGAWKVEDWDYDEDAGTVVVTGVELRNETKWRMTYGVSIYESGSLTITNLSAAAAVRVILQRFTQWSPEWVYPIDMPPHGPGGFTWTWEYWKKYTIDDLLTQIEEVGYEVVLRPYVTAAGQLRFETIVAPNVRVGFSVFHLQAEDSPLGGVGYKLSGAEQVTGGQGMGSGSGQDQPVAWSGGAPYIIPIRDAKRSFPDLTGDKLQAATNAWVNAARNPIAQWRVGTFTLSDKYGAADASVGRGWTLKSSGHPVFPNGNHEVRVIACSGSLSSQINVEVQSAAT